MIVARDTIYFDQLTETIPVEASLDQWVAQMRSLEFVLENPQGSADSINQVSGILFDHLLADRYTQLAPFMDFVIIPDQRLGYLSFEALRVPLNDAEHDGYLIQDHTVTYAYSATHYIASNDERSSAITDRFVGFAPSYDESTSHWENEDITLKMLVRSGHVNLPGAREEVHSIQSIVGGDVFLEDQATEYAFKHNVGEYDLVHLALHGLMNDEDPLLSRLVFDLSDTIEDGYLHAYEIFNLPLTADLVVLSACNTGFGLIEKGEGVMSLSRAFSYAGTPMMVASLWKAEDQAAKKLMVSFYENLASGQPMATALRSAKLEYLEVQKSDLLKHPYFWSGFVLYSQHFKSGSNNLRVWLVVGGSLLLLVFWLHRRRQDRLILSS